MRFGFTPKGVRHAGFIHRKTDNHTYGKDWGLLESHPSQFTRAGQLLTFRNRLHFDSQEHRQPEMKHGRPEGKLLGLAALHFMRAVMSAARTGTSLLILTDFFERLLSRVGSVVR